MKIRNGFVSNSSSSSFVLIGLQVSSDEVEKAYPTTEDDDSSDQLYQDEAFDSIYDDYSEVYYVGKLIADSDDIFEVPLDELTKDEDKKVEAALKKFNKDQKQVKLYGGTVSS
jgi:hypothetical protein